MQCVPVCFKEGTVFSSKPSSPCINTDQTILKKICQQHSLFILHYPAERGSNFNHECIYGFNHLFFSRSELLSSFHRRKIKMRKGNIISFTGHSMCQWQTWVQTQRVFLSRIHYSIKKTTLILVL